MRMPPRAAPGLPACPADTRVIAKEIGELKLAPVPHLIYTSKDLH